MWIFTYDRFGISWDSTFEKPDLTNILFPWLTTILCSISSWSFSSIYFNILLLLWWMVFHIYLLRIVTYLATLLARKNIQLLVMLMHILVVCSLHMSLVVVLSGSCKLLLSDHTYVGAVCKVILLIHFWDPKQQSYALGICRQHQGLKL